MHAVLQYRKQREEAAALKLSEAEERYRKAKTQLDEAKGHHTSLIENLHSKQIEGIAVELLIHYENRISWLNKQIEQLQDSCNEALQQVDKKRQMVIIRSTEKKAIERLREKQNTAYKKYLDAKENAQLDEISVLSHERKKLDKN